ncbi:MAG: ROK family protein [Solobacterium sp.]|jgi:glucokinase|nr:ROK family protein [Solobacterium sp.]
MQYILAIDLGGTTMRAAAVNEAGEVQEIKTGPTKKERPFDEVLQDLFSMAASLKNIDQCSMCGFAVCGPVDSSGMVTACDNLPGLVGCDLKQQIHDAFGISCVVLNDANAAGIGEAVYGAGRIADSAVYITVSTGIGASFISHGTLLQGGHGQAMEINSLPLQANDSRFARAGDCCGDMLSEYAQQILPELKIETTAEVFDLYRHGDPAIVTLMQEMIEALAHTFAIIVSILDPDIMILGGGLMKQKDLFLNQAIEQARAMMSESQKTIPFVLSELDEPGIIGAAAAALNQKEN